ncbi:tryptophan-rich sensory protein [Nocardioides sp. IC4_145]|uniref:tryptophan-rich sensory protein n=1 Tax=Nocardioides sp. IC4_145 TaxID=2714037 RepID=UPI001A996FF7|nr:tryptophan-rich sensory protein [Nocardioides sp. IC4_145]
MPPSDTSTSAPTRTAATRTDLARRVTVTVAAVACVTGTLVGTGVVGTPVADTAGGALSDDATLLAPAGPAFSIWSVIYAGLAAYAIWQWLPSQAASSRMRATGWLAAASMVLNAGWLLVTQQDWVWGSVVVIVALLAVLVELVRRLHRDPATSKVELVAVDGTFGLYLGWVAVATCANTAAALASDDIALSTLPSALVVVLVAAAGVGMSWAFGGRWAVAAAITWGLGWLAYGRVAEEPDSTPVAVVATVAAVVVVLAVVALHRRSPAASGSAASTRDASAAAAR